MAYLRRSTGTVTQRTLDSPILTTPALGTPASGTLSNATFPAGHPVNISRAYLTSDQSLYNSTGWQTFWAPTYTPVKNNSVVFAIGDFSIQVQGDSIANPYLEFKYDISGNDITDKADQYGHRFVSQYSAGGTDDWIHDVLKWAFTLIPVTLDGTGNDSISYAMKLRQPASNNNNTGWLVRGSGSDPGDKSTIIFWEYAQ